MGPTSKTHALGTAQTRCKRTGDGGMRRWLTSAAPIPPRAYFWGCSGEHGGHVPKISRLYTEAERIQDAGRCRKRVSLELSGRAVDGWNRLVEVGAAKGVSPAGLLSLLILHGSLRVQDVLSELPDPVVTVPAVQAK